MGDAASAMASELEGVLGPLFQGSKMPMLVVRPSGEILAVNPAAEAKYGYGRAEFCAMRVHDLIADDRDLDAEIRRSLEAEPAVLTRRPHRTKGGALLWVLPSVFALTVRGEVVLVSFLQDVTRLDAAEEEARAARQQAAELEVRAKAVRAELLAAERLASIGRVATAIAHEVNNPAALVTLNLGVVRDRLKGDDPRHAELAAMLDESLEAMGRIRDIVHDVKGFAADRGAERVDLSRLAADVIRMVQRGAGVRSSVDASFEPEVFARVRGSRVSQVLTNLLINAAQASEGSPESLHESGEAPAAPGGASAGEIRLRTFREGSAACIEVSDTGPGVPSHLAERIFEPFYTTRAGTGGTGLGLWLARGIVEEEGGTIALSERPGGGAVFRVSLPAAAP